MIYVIFATALFLLHFLPAIISKHLWLRYYACYVAYILSAITTAYVTYPIQLLFPSQGCKIPQFVATLISKVIGIDWELRNKSILEKCEHSIIVVNHQSLFDFLGLVNVLRPYKKFTGVARKEIYYVFPFGHMLHLFGVIFINRTNRKEAMAKMIGTFMSQEKTMIIFPEGTRNRHGQPFLPFKKGAFRLALQSKRPIIPIVLSPYYFIKPRKLFAGGKIVLSVLEPIITTSLTEENIDDLSIRTKELMEQEYIKLKKESSIYKENIK